MLLENSSDYEADIFSNVTRASLTVYPDTNLVWGVFQTLTIIIITIFIILGNITNIIVISTSLATFNITGYFLISLACADLGVGVLITPLAVGTSLLHDWRAVYGWTLCEAVGLVVAALCAISIYSITLLTIDKYVYIVYPLRYPRYFKPLQARAAILVTWALCLLYFVVHKLWWSTYYYDRKAYICSVDFPRQWDFTLFVIATIVLPPTVLIVYCNYKTFKVAQKHNTRIRDILRSVQPTANQNKDAEPTDGRQQITTTTAAAEGRKTTRSRTSRSSRAPPIHYQVIQRRALKMNMLIASAFFVAWVPYSIVQVIMSFVTDIDIAQPLIFTIQWVAFANSFWNCIIYYYLNREYRKKALQLYSRIFCRPAARPPPEL